MCKIVEIARCNLTSADRWWYNGYRMLDSRNGRSHEFDSGHSATSAPLSGNNLRQVVHTHVPLSANIAIWHMSRGSDVLRLVIRRSGVTLGMRHRPKWFLHLWVQGLKKGDEHSHQQHSSNEYGRHTSVCTPV